MHSIVFCKAARLLFPGAALLTTLRVCVRIWDGVGFGVRVSTIKRSKSNYLVNIFVSHRVVPYDDKNLVVLFPTQSTIWFSAIPRGGHLQEMPAHEPRFDSAVTKWSFVLLAISNRALQCHHRWCWFLIWICHWTLKILNILDFEFDVCRVAGAERNENLTANENLEAKSKQSQLSVPRR